MTTPSGPILGAVHLNDGINTKFDWNRATGLSDTSQVMAGSIQSTFDGPFRVTPRLQTRGQRDVMLTGYLYHAAGLAEGWSQLLSVQQLVASPLAMLQVGGLGLEIVPQTMRPDRLKAMQGTTVDYVTTVTAVPGNWRAMYGYAEGGAYGLTVNGETMNHTVGGAARTLDAFALDAGASPSVTNLGTAPTPLVLTISGRTTRFYVRSTASGYARRVSITPVNGVATITEDMGLFVPPGVSYLRYEEASGALIAGTIASSIYGTRWRWDGLTTTEATRSLPIVYNTRQTKAYYANAAFTTSSGLRTAHPDQPRFGNSGTYAAATAGLIIEPDRTNLCLQSQAIGSAPWANYSTAPTINSDASTAPDGTSTADQMVQTTAATLSGRSQSITVTAGATYVLSAYVRSGATYGNVALRIRIEDGAGVGITNYDFTSATNWTRHEILFTATTTTAVVFIRNSTTGNQMDAYWWGIQLEAATGQTAANATSYIPTTSTTQRRYPDVLAVRRLENLLCWSNRFDKTTASSTTRGLWYIAGAVTPTTATRQVGPSGVTDASSLAFAGANSGLQQRLLNAEQLAGKTVAFSVWVKNSTSTPDSDCFLRIEEIGGSGAGTTDHSFANLDDNWTRITVQRKLTAPTDVSLHIRSSGAITYYFAHAQATVATDSTYNLASGASFATAAPYVETQGSPYAAEGTWTWPQWLSQNGYIEADICLGQTANPNLANQFIIGGINTSYSSSLWAPSIYRGSAAGSASNSISYAFQNNAGTTATSYSPASTIYDGAFHKLRIEWVNYTISGVRTIRLYLYIDGSQVSSATTLGATAWLRPPILMLCATTTASDGAWQTMKNLAIGSPSIPSNAIPEPY